MQGNTKADDDGIAKKQTHFILYMLYVCYYLESK